MWGAAQAVFHATPAGTGCPRQRTVRLPARHRRDAMSEALSNEQHQPQPRQYTAPPNRRYAEEDRAWSQLYAAIGQTSTAEEVVKQLDADPQSKRIHLALYIRAKTTLREQKAADARVERIGAFVRHALDFIVLGPLRLLRAALSLGASVAVEAMPPVRREP